MKIRRLVVFSPVCNATRDLAGPAGLVSTVGRFFEMPPRARPAHTLTVRGAQERDV